ncbi:MAG: hypothetical protein BGO82_19055 [Devosia sp. 67-54]|uniref:GNAT family N-acetyltransferase n=1 Tax=unclassified Devosia TaxID=196773 RepID=UPI00095F8825|nr:MULTISPECIES: GNAT family N-acetyltransferase [unclassified Devosia]MBN9306192.1 GNAT family N-acetyltransferase [Devosia sp.]OJX18269.1 MAG: hypothetical protein BGO82_19055 [Devosia sp. 67-54]
MSAIVLRPARADEAELLGEIGFASWAASAFGRNDAGRTDRAALRREFCSFAAEAPDTVLVAEMAGEIAGWGAREHRNQEISDLWIGPAWQGRGIGAALLTRLVADIRTQGFAMAELETLAANRQAVRFYERHGFATVWHREKFSPALGYAIDKVGMNKSLVL